MVSHHRRVITLALLGAALGCSGSGDPRSGPAKPAGTTAASGSAAPAAAPPVRPLIDLVHALPGCDVDHRGLLFDLGTAAASGRYGWANGVPPGVTPVEHDGSTWAPSGLRPSAATNRRLRAVSR